MSNIYVVNENGEVINSFSDTENKRVCLLGSDDKIFKNESKRALKETKPVKFPFAKLNLPIIQTILETNPKLDIMFRFVPFLGYGTNVITYDNGRVVKYKDLYRILGLSDRQTKRIVKVLEQNEIILNYHDDEQGEIVLFNPWVCYRGKRIENRTYELFKYTKWSIDTEEYMER